MPYYDNFWHKDAQGNACLTFFCKNENWEPAYQICYCLLSSGQQRKTWNSCCKLQRETADFITQDLWPPNSPDLNAVDYRICAALPKESIFEHMLW